MKAKLFIYLALVLALLGCSFVSNLVPAPSQGEPNSDPVQEISTAGWLLPDPAAGLGSLESYHQQLTVSFHGTLDGTAYEWTNSYQHNVWNQAPASFLLLTTSETGVAPEERLMGAVDQAHYARSGADAPCQVSWGESVQGVEAGGLVEPASFLPPVEQAVDAGTETINDLTTHHYTIRTESSGANVEGDLWLAEPGGYVVRYVLVVSGGEGEQHLEYELSQVNALGEVLYPEGCSAVLSDFPVMDGARNLHRLPESVDYTVSAETEAVSQFYQEKLVAQGWEFVNSHDKDSENVLLVFANKDQNQAASLLLSASDSGVWVSAMLRPWEPTSGEEFVP